MSARTSADDKKRKAVIRSTAWVKANPERVKANQARWAERNKDKLVLQHQTGNLRRRYAITLEDKQRMYEAQQGLCAICQQPVEFSKTHTDHDHTTNKLRDLLCGLCNKGLGQFKDRPERLLAAISYLAKHAERSHAA